MREGGQERSTGGGARAGVGTCTGTAEAAPFPWRSDPPTTTTTRGWLSPPASPGGRCTPQVSGERMSRALRVSLPPGLLGRLAAARKPWWGALRPPRPPPGDGSDPWVLSSPAPAGGRGAQQNSRHPTEQASLILPASPGKRSSLSAPSLKRLQKRAVLPQGGCPTRRLNAEGGERVRQGLNTQPFLREAGRGRTAPGRTPPPPGCGLYPLRVALLSFSGSAPCPRILL